MQAKELELNLFTTSEICHKFLTQGDNSLNRDEMRYLFEVHRLPENDPNHKLVDAAANVYMYKGPVPIAQSAEESPKETDEQAEKEADNILDVYDAVQKFVDQHGITGTGSVGVEFSGGIIPYDVQVSTIKALNNELDRPESLGLGLEFMVAMKALAREVAKNLVYEEFIVSLAEMVGFASVDEGSDEDEFEVGVHDDEA